VIDDFISPKVVDILLKDYQMPGDRIKQDDNSELYNDGTLAQFRKDWLSMEIRSGVHVRRFFWELNSAEFLLFLQRLSGIDALIADPYRAGGGLHETRSGGFLMVHADYNRQPETDLDRRMNVIVYLNKDWQPEWGGDLELWTPDMK
jgi:Rps23 Pro-64 3,4-dihydroxylase Tpa1-like proline 4-hydroxylase